MKALATLFTLLLISNLIACSTINQISINIEEELSLKVNDNSNMTLVNISYIEELVKDFEKMFWDNVSGGYYNAMYNSEISSTAKNFQAVYYSLRLYSLLYKETGKIEYLEKINELFMIAEKFKDSDTELYYPILDENFTEPYGSADIAKLSFTLDYGYSLIVAYNITKNSTFLERAIEYKLLLPSDIFMNNLVEYIVNIVRNEDVCELVKKLALKIVSTLRERYEFQLRTYM